ncbi:hypothetical protein CDAR_211891 [Caerostris darwini]|uniref:Uncharacterized protein n=1 Tax=Caerostris darwini TaxID=1538125 RepID=A0AAV4PDY3_9ARAC|nr:hypothetical protein CDAR_211891 [Caerostris darwini]
MREIAPQMSVIWYCGTKSSFGLAQPFSSPAQCLKSRVFHKKRDVLPFCGRNDSGEDLFRERLFLMTPRIKKIEIKQGGTDGQ